MRAVRISGRRSTCWAFAITLAIGPSIACSERDAGPAGDPPEPAGAEGSTRGDRASRLELLVAELEEALAAWRGAELEPPAELLELAARLEAASTAERDGAETELDAWTEELARWEIVFEDRLTARAARAAARAQLARWTSLEERSESGANAEVASGLARLEEGERSLAAADYARAGQLFAEAERDLNTGLTALALDFRAPRDWRVLDSTPGASGWARLVEDPRTSMRFVWIEPGSFSMGSPEGEGQDTERPRHEVRLSRGFYCAETEVTRAAWRAFASTGREQPPSGGWVVQELRPEERGDVAAGFQLPWVWHEAADWRQPIPDVEFELDDRHPVTQVSWFEARAFCEHYGYRLPTEAEWERAARAGTSTAYWWGDDEAGGVDRMNFRDVAYARHFFGRDWGAIDDRHPLTSPVRSFAPNPWGLYDMAGNVWEWCADAHADEAYATHAPVDPFHDTGERRVLRGGSWNNLAFGCRSAERAKLSPADGSCHAGFRPVFAVPVEEEPR